MSQTPNYKAELVGVLGHPVTENPYAPIPLHRIDLQVAEN